MLRVPSGGASPVFGAPAGRGEAQGSRWRARCSEPRRPVWGPQVPSGADRRCSGPRRPGSVCGARVPSEAGRRCSGPRPSGASPWFRVGRSLGICMGRVLWSCACGSGGSAGSAADRLDGPPSGTATGGVRLPMIAPCLARQSSPVPPPGTAKPRWLPTNPPTVGARRLPE